MNGPQEFKAPWGKLLKSISIGVVALVHFHLAGQRSDRGTRPGAGLSMAESVAG